MDLSSLELHVAVVVGHFENAEFAAFGMDICDILGTAILGSQNRLELPPEIPLILRPGKEPSIAQSGNNSDTTEAPLGTMLDT